MQRGLDATQAFAIFVQHALTPARMARFSALAVNAKVQRKLLGALDHDFEKALSPVAKRGIVDRNAGCYAYHSSVGFGAEFSSVADAFARLQADDGWLIIVLDGLSGIYRPEANWNATIEIVT